MMAKKRAVSNSEEPEVDEAKQVALEKALGDITKRYGDSSIMRLGEAHQLVVEAIPTGALSLDMALGVGGVPRGRITGNLWTRILWENNSVPAYHRRSTEDGWHLRVY